MTLGQDLSNFDHFSDNYAIDNFDVTNLQQLTFNDQFNQEIVSWNFNSLYPNNMLASYEIINSWAPNSSFESDSLSLMPFETLPITSDQPYNLTCICDTTNIVQLIILNCKHLICYSCLSQLAALDCPYCRCTIDYQNVKRYNPA